MVAFSKGHGAGNDFIVIADPDGQRDVAPEMVAALCDRRFGIGADGLLRVVRSAVHPEATASLAEEPAAEWFMDLRDADGSPADANADAVRLCAHYLLRAGLASIPDGSTLPIATRGGVRDVTGGPSGYQVDLGRWRLDAGDVLARAAGLNVPRPGVGIHVGSPHIVVALASESDLDRVDLTVSPELSEEPPAGAAIVFVVPGEPLVRDGIGQVRMRVYEHGRGETWGGGASAAAAALAVRYWAGETAPDHWRVATPGDALGVRMFATEDGEHIGLSGPAHLVYHGEISLG